MKKLLLIALCVMFCSITHAQDIIVLNNADEIQAKVTAIDQQSVTYKKWSNLEGPTYTMPKSEIFYIKYANGEKDIMQEQAATIQPTPLSKTRVVASTPASTPRPTTTANVKFQGYVNLGTNFYAEGAGPTLDVNFGARIFEHLYLGFETGFHSIITPFEIWGSSYGFETIRIFEAYVPIGINMKGYFTQGKKVTPYVNCSLGGFIGIADLGGFNGFFCQVGLGMDIKRFSVGMGYNGLVKGGAFHCGYFKLGIRFGK